MGEAAARVADRNSLVADPMMVLQAVAVQILKMRRQKNLRRVEIRSWVLQRASRVVFVLQILNRDTRL